MVNLMFSKFMGHHAKVYTSPREAEYRRSIFEANLKEISDHNHKYATGHSKFRMGVTRFADLTEAEFMRRFASADLGGRKNKNSENGVRAGGDLLGGTGRRKQQGQKASEGVEPETSTMVGGVSGKGVYFEDLHVKKSIENGVSGKAVYFEDLKAQTKRDLLQNANKASKPNSNKPKPHPFITADLYKQHNLSSPNYSNISWLDKGYMTPIENQAACGACYSFASVAATEVAYMLQIGKKTNKQVFSKQEMVDCGPGTNYYLKGCHGGVLSSAYSYLDTFGIGLANEYPYIASQSKCRRDSVKRFLRTSQYTLMKTPKLDTLLDMVAHNPTALAIEVKPSYQHFTGGYVDVKGPCGFFFNHAIMAVGYDVRPDELKYMLLKNTYGLEWGEDGYMKYLVGIGPSGMCGFINDNASYPIM